MADDVLEQPKSRHTPSVDFQHGYEAEVDDAEGRGKSPLFRDLIALHHSNAAELWACQGVSRVP